MVILFTLLIRNFLLFFLKGSEINDIFCEFYRSLVFYKIVALRIILAGSALWKIFVLLTKL